MTNYNERLDEIIELANKHGYTGGDTELRLAIQAYANSELQSFTKTIKQGPPYTDHNCTYEDCDFCKANKVTRTVNARWRVWIDKNYWERLAQLSNPQEEK